MRGEYNLGNLTKGSRKIGVFVFVIGFITMIAGYGAWKSPQLDWEAFLQTLEQFFVMSLDEISNMFTHPFSFVGLIVLFVGVIMILTGIKDVISS